MSFRLRGLCLTDFESINQLNGNFVIVFSLCLDECKRFPKGTAYYQDWKKSIEQLKKISKHTLILTQLTKTYCDNN